MVIDSSWFNAARFWGERIAASGDDESWSYADLAGRVRRVGQALGAADPSRPPRVVALLLTHGVSTATGLLGAFHSGNAAVPMDANDPPAHLLQVLEDSQAEVLLCDAGTRSMAREIAGEVRIVDLDELGKLAPLPQAPSLATDDGAEPEPAYDARRPVCLIYTSGTTGRPKGVVHTRGGLAAEVSRISDALGIGPQDHISHTLSCSVTGGLREILLALGNGARLCPYPLRREGVTKLPEWLGRHGITVFRTVSTVFRALLPMFEPGRVPPSLRLIYIGGETVTTREAREFQRLFGPHCEFHTVFGSTETGICVRHAIRTDTPLEDDRLPIGVPLPGVEVRLLDESGREVPPGEIGEIVLGSDAVASGYWQRPELTAERFTEDLAQGLRTYRMGDLGRLLPDGQLEHLGRLDLQVKVRGVRVEIAQVESVIRDVPGIADAAVIARPTEPGGSLELIAYAATNGQAPVDASAVCQACAQRLPPAAIPAAVVFLERLPQTRMGKVDRQALAQRGDARALIVAAALGEASSDPMERELAELWGRQLGRERVGVDDDYFALGGTSLRAIDLLLQVEERWGRRIALGPFCRAATVSRMAKMLKQATPGLAEVGQRGQGAQASVRLVQGVVELRPGRDELPLYCVHSVVGSLLHFEKLSECLSMGQAVYGLEPPPLSEGRFDDLPSMAAAYVARLKRHRPHGPYALTGYSFGAILAYEMAWQLNAAGESTPFVALLDPFLRHVGGDALRSALAFMINTPRWLAEEWRRDRGVRLRQRIRRKLGEIARRSAGRPAVDDTQAAMALRMEQAFPGQGESMPQRLREMIQEHTRLVDGYQPRAGAGPVILFMARVRPLTHSLDPVSIWRKLTPSLSVHVTPGDHATMMEPPNLAKLAAAMDARFAQGLNVCMLGATDTRP